MIHKVFAVYDNKAAAFLPPFFLPNRAMAVRSFRDAANSPEHQISRHSEDYALHELGEWDDAAGQFSSHEHPPVIVVAAALKEAAQ